MGGLLRRRNWWLGVTAVLVGMSGASVQLPAQQARPRFRGGVDYVRVDVVVTDTHDRPVTDLVKDDFEIREVGAPQRILDFDRILVAIGRRPVDLGQPPAPPPDVASNVPPTRESRAFVFVIDDGAIQVGDLVPLKRAMTEFLRTMSPDDMAAVTYIRRSDLGQDFTHDIGRLVRAVNNARAAVGWRPSLGATLVVIRNAVDTVARAPQSRHVVIYVSSGFSLDLAPAIANANGWFTNNYRERQNIQDLLTLFGEARHGDVPIYTLDPHGLNSPESIVGIGRIPSPQVRQGWAEGIRLQEQFLRTVAGATGGRAFVNQTNLGAAVDAIMAENGSYYVLGYSPTPYRADGKYHPIDVIVKRHGVRVRARPGYVAEKPDRAAGAETHLLRALADGMPRSDLSLRLSATPVCPAPDGISTVVTIDVRYPPTAQPPRRDDHLDLAWLALDTDGQVKRSGQQTLPVPLEQVGTGPLSIDDVLDLPRGKLVLRVGAASETLGIMGTVHMPLEVAALSTHRLEVVPLVIGEKAVDPRRVARAERIAAIVPFQPTTQRTFAASQQVRIFSRIFGSRSQTPAVQLLLTRGKATERRVPVRLTPSASVAGALDVEAALAFTGLSPGDYVLRLEVRDGKTTVERALPIAIR